jgi:hypothetical protein
MRTNRTRRIWTGSAIGLMGLTVLVGGEVVAQPARPGVDVTAPTPAPAPPPRERWFEPTAPLEQQGTREQEFYPGPVRSRHDPAFIRPFTTTAPVSETSSVRAGLSGWTAPALPFDIPQATGGVAFGFTIQWDVPVRGAQPPEPPDSQR